MHGKLRMCSYMWDFRHQLTVHLHNVPHTIIRSAIGPSPVLVLAQHEMSNLPPWVILNLPSGKVKFPHWVNSKLPSSLIGSPNGEPMRSRGGVRRRRRRRPLAEHVSQPLNGFHSNSVFWHIQEIPPDAFFIFAI
jgi:hypothetical protein